MEAKFYIQLVCVILIAVFFIWQFIKTKRIAQLLIAIWAPITLLSYVPAGKTFTYILSGVEFLFFIAVIFFLFKGNRKGYVKNMLGDSLPDGTNGGDGQKSGDSGESKQ